MSDQGHKSSLDDPVLRVRILTLTQAFAEENATEIATIHNSIPYVSWAPPDAARDQDALGFPYVDRWTWSLVALLDDRIVGIAYAHLRESDERHPFLSVYLHRLAIAEEWRGIGLGTNLVGALRARAFGSLPRLQSITVQTNDELSNVKVLEFYARLGFERAVPVAYPEKQDVLLVAGRESLTESEVRRFAHLVASPIERTRSAKTLDQFPARIYFGTSSVEKIQQYTYLARAYSTVVERAPFRIALDEPQVDGVGHADEETVVRRPLKIFAPFAKRSNKYPFMVEDTMLFIEGFNRAFDLEALLPGPDTKRWWRALGNEGLLELLSGSLRRRARYVVQIGILTADGAYAVERAELDGTVATDIRSQDIWQMPYSNATFFHKVFVPNGSEQTLGEMDPSVFYLFDYRRRCLERVIRRLKDFPWDDNLELRF